MVERRNILKRVLQPLLVLGVYFFLYLPIVILVLFSFNNSEVSFTWQGFSWQWYKELLGNSELLNAAGVSLIVASASSLLSALLATGLVMVSRWSKFRFMYSYFYINLILPDIILAIGLMSLFSFFNIPLGFPSLIAGHTLIGIGFAVPILRARMSEFDDALLEASLDLGANYAQTCRYIILPLLKPGFIAVFLLVFTLSLDDFMISFFCSGPSVQTLSVYIYYQIRLLANPSINAISTCILALSSCIVMLLCYLEVVDTTVLND